MEEQVIKRVMPNSTEAEQAVIGSMIIDRDAIIKASEILTPDDFYQKQYGLIFETLVELCNEGKPADLVVLQDRLKEKKAPEEISNLEYVRELLRNTDTSSNIAFYANIVKEKSTLRKLIRTAEGIANDCYKSDAPLEEIMENAEKDMFNIFQDNGNQDYKPINVIAVEQLQRIALAAKTKGGITGLRTGFHALDYMTAGFQPSDYILIAARPSMGKTAFVLNIAQHVAISERQPVLIFSLEMNEGQLFNRLLSLESKVNAQNIMKGELSEDEWNRIGEGADTVGSSPIIIENTPALTIGELRSKCRRHKLEHGIKLVIIDYLQLMTSKGRVEARQQEVSDISRSLKAIARELDIPVVVLSQLSREVEKRPNHRPVLSDLRESGSIEQDADVVMFIYRDEYYHPENEESRGIAEINIAKQRNGPIGKVELAWNPEYTRFLNIDNQRNGN
ncbi:MAG: replicative DNA helicase [Lachnospiraceae bacterium]|nr:replicative DNA helicase [Lachnospiraceae bacterium]